MISEMDRDARCGCFERTEMPSAVTRETLGHRTRKPMFATVSASILRMRKNVCSLFFFQAFPTTPGATATSFLT